MTTFEIASQSTAIFAANEDTTTTGGAAIPVDGCLELTFVCYGSASAAVTVSLLESDEEAGGYTEVAPEDVYGGFALTSADSTGKAGVFAYKGWKNFVKVAVDGTATALTVIALKSGCRHCPTDAA